MLKNTEIFDSLLDAIYPALNQLHRLNASRRFWGILLYRYLRNCMMAHASRLPAHRPHPPPNRDGSVLGLRVGQSLVPVVGFRRTAASWLLRSWLPRHGSRLIRSKDLHTWPTPIIAIEAGHDSVLGEFHYSEPIRTLVQQPVTFLMEPKSKRPLAVEPEKRMVLAEISGGVNDALARLAFDWLPRYYVEEFVGRYNCVELSTPEKKSFHASFFSSLGKRFVTARYVDAGAELFIYQHSAMYGEIEDHVFHHVETSVSDRFLTWGWELREKDVPFLALRLIKPERERIRSVPDAQNWVYVNVRQPFVWNIDETLQIQERFVLSLPPALRRNIVVRPRVNHGGSARSQVSERIGRQIKGVDGGTASFTKLLGKAEIVVLDMFPSTAFMECLSVGKPVIAIVPDSTVFTALAWEFYADFFKLGLLHHTPEEAAGFLTGTHIRGWWSEILGNDLVTLYMNTFCRVRR